MPLTTLLSLALMRAVMRAFVLAAPLAVAGAPARANDALALSDAFIWTGLSERVARRSLDRRDAPAIAAVERRLGSWPDGRLDGGERRALRAAADRVRAREGYDVVTDPATGARIGLPTAWLASRRPTPTGEGSLWRSPDGAVTVETFARPGTLDGFERAERREVAATYVAGRGRWRVVSGHAPGARTVYARAVPRDGRAVGFRVTYETALAHRLDRVAVAMSSDFRAPHDLPDGPPNADALAYAPERTRAPDRFDGFDDGSGDGMSDGFDAPPRYAVLPERGPAARERPVVASLEPTAPSVAPPVAPEPEVDPAPEAIAPGATAAPPRERAVPRRDPTARASRPPSAPLSLDDATDALTLDPARGSAPRADDDATEAAVPRTITGLVTEEGQTCPTLRGADGTLYALVGEVPALEPGTLVSIEAVGVDTTRCSAGRTVAVGGLTVRSSPQ